MLGVDTADADVEAGVEDGGALGELYVRHAPGARRLAYFLTGDRELADDLVQDAFVRLAGRFRHHRHPDAFEAYLRRTIVNLFTSHLRRLRLERREVRRERRERRPGSSQADLAERDELWAALKTLAPRQRAALVLRYYEDLSERETADVLRCSVGAVKQLVMRGLSAMRDKVGNEET